MNKTIRRWDQEEDEWACELFQETLSDSGEVHSCCLLPEARPYDGFGCLANIVSMLVGFLDFCSDYVKHSAGNILISVSSTLIKFESIWIQFIELAWGAIHAASKCVHNTSHSTTDSNSDDSTSSGTRITSFMTALSEHRLNTSRQTMSSLFRVLHAILKFLKQSDSDLKDDFICLSIHQIHKMPWNLFHQLHAGGLASCAKDSRFSTSNDSAQSRILTGSLLQLLGSLLDQSYLRDTDGQDMFVKLVDVVPKIASLSLGGQHDGSKSLYQYLKHKILMVMMRLKPYIQQDCSHIVSWLKLLRRYFGDLLHQPISQHIAKPENCLEDSPFLLDMVDLVESQDKSTRHLQRLVSEVLSKWEYRLKIIKFRVILSGIVYGGG